MNMLRNKRFLNAYAKIMAVGLRVVAAWFCVAGFAFIFSSLLTSGLRPWGLVAGIVVLAMGVGGFFARPVSGEDLSRMQEDIGRSHVSDLRAISLKKRNEP
jgi:hypothetical protein